MGMGPVMARSLSKRHGTLPITTRATPTGSYARCIWFLYEWLTGQRLALPDADKGTYVPAVDPEQQWARTGENSTCS